MTTINIKSEITGMVCQVAVEVGQRVEEDDVILLVESMKMEIPITAPRSGTITQIHRSVGDAVAEDEEIAVLEIS